jgi:predicted AlkP superfamily pyrophosphatase or phosphodiesterase
MARPLIKIHIMKRFASLIAFLVLPCYGIFSQTLARPRLVVGVVVDQMRWDYLYRYYDRYAADGGFKRFLGEGFTCENTLIPYAPTVTACGHATLYSGAPPAVSGITGNVWWDRQKGRTVYCTEDNSVATVGSSSSQGKQSPANLFVTTICDELRLATNFRSKVIGIALKDRGGILTAGHSANAAYWYDNSNGNWITSTYYMNELPAWVNSYNNKKRVDAFYEQGWSLLYPKSTYTQSTADDKPYESKPFGAEFPYDTKRFVGKDYGKVTTMPAGNKLTLEFSMAAIEAEKLGEDAFTDFIAISFSSPDYIGHTFGPNSIETEDGFLRLDRDLGELFRYLDSKIGKGNYTMFLSADHGVAHTPEFMNENHLPGGRVKISEMVRNMNQQLFEKYKVRNLIVSDDNYQLHFDHRLIDSLGADLPEMSQWAASYMQRQPGISRAFPVAGLNTIPLPEIIRRMLNNAFHPQRNGDVQYILQPNHIEAYSTTGTTHGLWNPYDAHIPLLWYGWGIRKGKTNRATYSTDVAATLAALLRIQEPNGSVGNVITEALK